MNLSDTIDLLIKQDSCFALYRLPWTDEPILLLQEKKDIDTFSSLTDLNEKTGFVFAPFCPTSVHPIILIHPDHIIHEWKNIEEFLQEKHAIFSSKKNKSPHSFIQKTVTNEEEEKQQYKDVFRRFMQPLQQREFQKLVLSRKSVVALNKNFSPFGAFMQAYNKYPRMMVSLCHTPISGTWIGSTPEIILKGQEYEWQTVSLAGTMHLENETMPSEWSKKNRDEQAFVSEYIRRTLKSCGIKSTEKGPYTAKAGQVVHLKTDFYFHLKETKSIGTLLKALYPTPAICGLPKTETYEFILENEGYDRSYYSGIVGYLNPEKDTSLYVNLRCMNITPQEATLYAGGGILPLSTAETEWEETLYKMTTMGSILQ